MNAERDVEKKREPRPIEEAQAQQDKAFYWERVRRLSKEVKKA